MAKTFKDWVASDVDPGRKMTIRSLSEHYFFRDPVRPRYSDSNFLFSPADGVILYQKIVDAAEPLVEIKGREYTLLQAFSPLLRTPKISNAPLHPHPVELIATLLHSPLAAALFTWALRFAPPNTGTLVTTGSYRSLRHPIYLTFFAMLLAAAILYLATGLRLAVEEEELTERFPETYPRYQQQTPSRYLPGLR